MLRTIAEIGEADAADCGAKAATLGVLSLRGYRVPQGIVATTKALDRFVAAAGLAGYLEDRAAESAAAAPDRLAEIAAEIAEAFESASLPDEMVADIAAWMASSGSALFAVRSSANNEDLRGATFAGQYSSYLNVPPEEVAPQVCRCFASLFNARATLYRRRKGIGDVGKMAVIVQEMVPSEWAGVVFTKAPRAGANLLLECAPGTGDAVVSGAVKPNRYFLDRSTMALEASREVNSISFSAIRAVAETALAIERDLGEPQDIEYGVVKNLIYILQSRPLAA
jgi:phosphoenolpyruvate synthase/pyruvate phosphate dikinase